MSVNISQMFEGFEPNELEQIRLAHQTFYEVQSMCMSDGCVEPGVYYEWLEQYINRHQDVQVMIRVMLDRFEYDESDLDYSININDWTLYKSDMMSACQDQYEVWSNLVDDMTSIDERYNALNNMYWLDRAIYRLDRAF